MKIRVSKIVPGRIVRYHNAPCIVLEHRKDGTLLLEMDKTNRPFGSANNYAESALRDYFNGVHLASVTNGHPDEIIARTVDLAALNGSTEYGTVKCKLAPLTLDELRKYHDILPRPESFEWSVTPWSTPKVDGEDKRILGLTAGGSLGNSICAGTGDARSAFIIPSALAVEVGGDDGLGDPNPLRRYTAKELVAELLRRLAG